MRVWPLALPGWAPMRRSRLRLLNQTPFRLDQRITEGRQSEAAGDLLAADLSAQKAIGLMFRPL